MENDQTRMTNLQSRLSMLRQDLDNRRNTKYDQLMSRITELSQTVDQAKSTNDASFQQINERLQTLSKDIEKESKALENVFETKTQELEAARQNLQEQVRILEQERNETGKELVKEIETKFGAIRDELGVESLRRQDDAHARQDIFDQDLPRIKTGLTAEREQTKFQIAEVENKVKQVVTALQQMLHQEKQVRTKWQTDLQGLIMEVDKRLNADLLKEKRAREASEKQLITLLEQATQSYLQFDEDKV
ncbi:Conserved_hypothetical protein [Hexamita inflata]|uniref:Uncharacterized protein n=1 Tax=Hexamita inflata TaxID=28002 RepID=A0AA86QXW0_9EUKA|nr:Conserved hypothetical protein [Hexamita inflata]